MPLVFAIVPRPCRSVFVVFAHCQIRFSSLGVVYHRGRMVSSALVAAVLRRSFSYSAALSAAAREFVYLI
jgi:hypothetical protein